MAVRLIRSRRITPSRLFAGKGEKRVVVHKRKAQKPRYKGYLKYTRGGFARGH